MMGSCSRRKQRNAAWFWVCSCSCFSGCHSEAKPSEPASSRFLPVPPQALCGSSNLVQFQITYFLGSTNEERETAGSSLRLGMTTRKARTTAKAEAASLAGMTTRKAKTKTTAREAAKRKDFRRRQNLCGTH